MSERPMFRGGGGRGGGRGGRGGFGGVSGGGGGRGGFGGGGGGRGRGRGGFRGGGRGGGAPHDRTAGRDATSIEKLFTKNTRYDHRVAKEQKFWEKSKKLRSYHRLLKKEGLEGARDAPQPPPPPPMLPAAVSQPDELFAAAPDALPKPAAPRPKKKRAREEGDDTGAAAADGSATAAAASSGPSRLSNGATSSAPGGPVTKKARLSPEELASLKAEKKAAFQAKQAQLVVAQERRREVKEKLTARNERGQPKLANHMQHLLEKLQKQAAAKAAGNGATAGVGRH